MTDPVPGEVTTALQALRSGDPTARERLYSLVYEELRKLARSRMSREGYDTLQPTALVHEAFLKLVRGSSPEWESRGHFFGAAAEAMRQILIDRARARMRQKRGAGADRVELREEMAVDQPRLAEILELDIALDRLDAVEPAHARVIKLRYFAGLTVEETADILRVSPRTVDRMWYSARAWLKQQMSEPGHPGEQ